MRSPDIKLISRLRFNCWKRHLICLRALNCVVHKSRAVGYLTSLPVNNATHRALIISHFKHVASVVIWAIRRLLSIRLLSNILTLKHANVFIFEGDFRNLINILLAIFVSFISKTILRSFRHKAFNRLVECYVVLSVYRADFAFWKKILAVLINILYLILARIVRLVNKLASILFLVLRGFKARELLIWEVRFITIDCFRIVAQMLTQAGNRLSRNVIHHRGFGCV